MAPAQPTGAGDASKGAATTGRPRSASPGAKKGAKTAFSGSRSVRALRMDIMGEETPGPGSYLPASTFGKHASASNKQFAKLASPQFRSTSKQRPNAINEHVPGPGAHSPNKAAIEKNRTNPGSSMKAKGKDRFAKVGGGEEGVIATAPIVGPGTYDSHVHNSVQQIVAKQVVMMSRQNPGFGIAGPAHKLPHEQPVEDDKELPGPGKYETNTSEIAQANGHNSSFKLPTERKLKKQSGFEEDGTGKKGGGKKGVGDKTKSKK